MSGSRNRVEVFHGVNLDQLGRRDPELYGNVSFRELETQIERFGRELGLTVSFFQTNHEGNFVERLHRVEDIADGLIINPGAWSHYSYAIRDALELAGVPAVEVHISDISRREEWRRQSVISDLCRATVSGKGVEGYREALELLKQELASA